MYFVKINRSQIQTQMKKALILLLPLLISSRLAVGQCNYNLTNNIFAGCAPLEVLFNYTGINTGTVTWSLDNTTQLGTAFAHTFALPAVYTITITIAVSNATGVCTSSTVKTVSVFTGPAYGCSTTVINGIKERVGDREVLIYPNPNRGFFQLKLDDDLENPAIILIDGLGQNVYEQKISRGLNTIEYDTLKSGLYTLCLFRNGECINTYKLAIE